MTHTWNIPPTPGPTDDAPAPNEHTPPMWDKGSPLLPLTVAATVPITTSDAHTWAAHHLGTAAQKCARRAMTATNDTVKNDAIAVLTTIVDMGGKMLAARMNDDGGATVDGIARDMLRTVVPLAAGTEIREIVLAYAYLDMARTARLAVDIPSLQRDRVPVPQPF